jgi:ribosomal protein L32
MPMQQFQLLPEFAGMNYDNNMQEEKHPQDFEVFDSLKELLDTYIWRMAAPKNRKTKGKKHLKHERKIPHKIEWSYCKRCGKPRRPHRVCTEFLEICAMREKDYKIHMRNKEAEKAAQQHEDT